MFPVLTNIVAPLFTVIVPVAPAALNVLSTSNMPVWTVTDPPVETATFPRANVVEEVEAANTKVFNGAAGPQTLIAKGAELGVPVPVNLRVKLGLIVATFGAEYAGVVLLL